VIGLGRYKTVSQVAIAYVDGDIDLPVALYLFEEIEWDLPRSNCHTTSMGVAGVAEFVQLIRGMIAANLDQEPNGYSRVNVYRAIDDGIFASVKRPSAWKKLKKNQDYYWIIGTNKELWPGIKITIGNPDSFGTAGSIVELFTPKAPEDLGVHLRSIYHRWLAGRQR